MLPRRFRKHLRLPEAELRAGLDFLAGAGRVSRMALPERGDWYVWGAA